MAAAKAQGAAKVEGADGRRNLLRIFTETGNTRRTLISFCELVQAKRHFLG
jgi:hypothetical protein